MYKANTTPFCRPTFPFVTISARSVISWNGIAVFAPFIIPLYISFAASITYSRRRAHLPAACPSGGDTVAQIKQFVGHRRDRYVDFAPTPALSSKAMTALATVQRRCQKSLLTIGHAAVASAASAADVRQVSATSVRTNLQSSPRRRRRWIADIVWKVVDWLGSISRRWSTADPRRRRANSVLIRRVVLLIVRQAATRVSDSQHDSRRPSPRALLAIPRQLVKAITMSFSRIQPSAWFWDVTRSDGFWQTCWWNYQSRASEGAGRVRKQIEYKFIYRLATWKRSTE